MSGREALGLAGVLFLGAFVVAILALNRIGRRLVRRLQESQPELYNDLGHPLPTLFPSERRMKFDDFVMQRRYESLADGDLARRFARLRKLEFRLLALAVFVLVIMANALYSL